MKSNELCFEKKTKLIEMYGGKCEKCGYDRNYASLSFHHEDETLSRQKQKDNKGHTVTFITSRLAGEILATGIPDKRIHLLCANCHMEEHHPTWASKHKLMRELKIYEKQESA